MSQIVHRMCNFREIVTLTSPNPFIFPIINSIDQISWAEYMVLQTYNLLMFEIYIIAERSKSCPAVLQHVLFKQFGYVHDKV